MGSRWIDWCAMSVGLCPKVVRRCSPHGVSGCRTHASSHLKEHADADRARAKQVWRLAECCFRHCSCIPDLLALYPFVPPSGSEPKPEFFSGSARAHPAGLYPVRTRLSWSLGEFVAASAVTWEGLGGERRRTGALSLCRQLVHSAAAAMCSALSSALLSSARLSPVLDRPPVFPYGGCGKGKKIC